MRFVKLEAAPLGADRRFFLLTPAERGAWLTLLCHAATVNDGPGHLADREEAVALLLRDRFDDPERAVTRLLDRGLLAEDAGGSITFPTHVDWRFRKPSDEPEATRARKRRQRERQRPEQPKRAEPEQDGDCYPHPCGTYVSPISGPAKCDAHDPHLARAV